MLTRMRESIKNSKVTKFVLLLFICAPFAFFGINSYFGNSGSVFAVKVDGTEVPVRVFEEEMNMQRNRLRQAFGGSIPDGFQSEDLLKQQALESIITSSVLRNVVDEHKLVVSDASLAAAIVEMEQFQSDGGFDQQRYESQLRSIGYTVDSFESQYRSDVALQELRNSIVESNFVLSTEENVANSLNNQVREASILTFKLDPIVEETVIDDVQISEHYDANKTNYQHPERVKIEYIELNSTMLEALVEVSDEDARVYFDTNSADYRVPEERSASHILVALAEDASDDLVAEKLQLAQDIKAKLDSGESFETLASDYSEDPGSASNGGSLGFFGKGMMVQAFEEAAFAMDVGAISEPVRSNFGYHIIRLDELKEERGKDFEAVKSEIIDLIKTQKANESFYDQSELLANQTYENPDTLVPAAEEGGFTVQTSDWIDRFTEEGIGANPQILTTALSDDVLNGGNNSQPVELGESHVVVLRVLEHEGPREKTLEEVSDQIATELKRSEAIKSLETLVDEARKKLKDGVEMQTLAEETSGELTATTAISRDNSELDRTIVSTVFAMPKPAAGNSSIDVASMADGSQSIIMLTEVSAGEAENTNSGNLLNPSTIGLVDYEAFVGSLRSKAQVEINQQLLEPASQ